MTTTVEIVFLVIALAFTVLVVFLAIAAVAACRTLKQVNQTLASLQKQIDDLDDTPSKLLNNVNDISADMRDKMRCLDPVFHSISNVGERVESHTARFKESQLVDLLERRQSTRMDSVTEMVELALIGLSLWQKFKKRS